MNQSLGKPVSTSLKVSSETTHLRRRILRADQLFSSGLARLQSEYKARIKAAACGEPEEETPEQTTEPSEVSA